MRLQKQIMKHVRSLVVDNEVSNKIHAKERTSWTKLVWTWLVWRLLYHHLINKELSSSRKSSECIQFSYNFSLANFIWKEKAYPDLFDIITISRPSIFPQCHVHTGSNQVRFDCIDVFLCIASFTSGIVAPQTESISHVFYIFVLPCFFCNRASIPATCSQQEFITHILPNTISFVFHSVEQQQLSSPLVLRKEDAWWMS